MDLCVYWFQLNRLKHVAIFGPVAPPEDTAKEVDELSSSLANLPSCQAMSSKYWPPDAGSYCPPGDTWVEGGLNSCNSAPMPGEARDTGPPPDS